ncbi:MAG: type III-A CRISPR-associated RAMP protein Csm4 [Candidatus Methanomethylicaceae archaeon]
MPAAFYLNPLGFMPREVRSDTIASAVIWSLAEMGRDVEPLIKDGSLRVSSAMPMLKTQGNERVLFFPKPKIPPPAKAGSADIDKIKSYKQVSYLQDKIFIDLLSGSLSVWDIVSRIDQNYEVRGQLIAEKGVLENFDLMPWTRVRNAVNRIKGGAENFFTSHGTFYMNAGLFFLLEGSDDWVSSTVLALRFLQDRGIGGEVSIGHGRFNFETYEREIQHRIKEIILPSGANGEGAPEDEGAVLLSLYLPKPEEWIKICSRKDRLYYSLCWRAGRRSSGPKKRVLFLEEGSVVPLVKVEGMHEVVAANPPSLEWGHPLFARIRLGGDL